MIDLETQEGERVHLISDPIVSMMMSADAAASAGRGGIASSPDSGSGSSTTGEDLTDDDDMELMNRVFDNVDANEPCKVQIRQLGEYMARLTLKGGHSVPLRVEVLKR